MSEIPWSAKGDKAVPVGADKLMILDSEDIPGPTQNKLISIDALLGSGEAESNAVLGLVADQNISLPGDVVDWDQNFIFGDTTKIVDQGNGIFKLSNGVFLLGTHLAIEMSAGGSGSEAVLAWQSSPVFGGPYSDIPTPQGRKGTYSTGRSDFTTQPRATAIVDATSADVFVQAFIDPSANTADILAVASSATIESLGSSSLAKTPLAFKGDLLVHNGISEQRLPVGNDGKVVVADSSVSDGVKWIPRGYELLADVTLGVVSDTIDVIIPARTILKAKLMLHPDSGNLNAEFNFNDDFAANYAFRRTENMDYNAGISDEVNADRVPLEPGTISDKVTVFLEIENQSGEETTFNADTTAVDGSVAVVPETQIIKGHWHDVAQVIKLNISTTINNFAANSRVLIYGSKD